MVPKTCKVNEWVGVADHFYRYLPQNIIFIYANLYQGQQELNCFVVLELLKSIVIFLKHTKPCLLSHKVRDEKQNSNIKHKQIKRQNTVSRYDIICF
jgi:hypothetical protein